MTLKCPKCQSERIETKNYAKKTGSTIGTVAGAARGAAVVVAGAEIGATAGLIAGPVGVTIGSIAGAIIGGLVGGAVGGAAGAMFGEVVDDNILDNYQCLACEYTFSKKDTSLNADDSTGLESNRHVDQKDHPNGFGDDHSQTATTATNLSLLEPIACQHFQNQ